MNYWDTSAILKLYVAETDSTYFLDLIASSSEAVYTSAIAEVEMLSALARKESEGGLPAGSTSTLVTRFRSDCSAGRIVLVSYGHAIVQEAERIAKVAYRRKRPVLIRSLDLIHMATFSSINASTLIATDQRLRDLGVLLKVSVLP